jgi:hypothetical protein
LPPAATFLGALEFDQVPLEPRHKIFGDLQPGLFVAEVSLHLGDAFLCGLAFPANKIRLLLQGATVDDFPLQRGLVCGRLPPQLG